MGISAYGLTYRDWENAFQREGFSHHALHFWLDGLYKNPELWDRHISKSMLERFEALMSFKLPEISKVQESQDGTVKFQMRFEDGQEVETVLIPFNKKFTVCLSTQVGCGMNCSFCFTGTQGLKRNLSAGEIVGQYHQAYKWLLGKDAKAPKPRIVFMGQGEPLHNVDEVEQSIKVLSDTKLIDVNHRQMTLSTVGHLPNLFRLKTFPRVNVALSLHSPFEDERNQLIPVNQTWPLQKVLEGLAEIPLLNKQFITFEYILIKDFNMAKRHADELARILHGKKAIMNLIPFNPFPGSKWERPAPEAVEAFKELLVTRKIRVMVRTTKGDDILAACGQLKIAEMARNYGTQTR